MNKPILVAAAWPYANGSLHLGHIAALLGADIIARYQRARGNDVLFVSGSDCHGTPIAVEAEKQGVHPLTIAEKYHREFEATLVAGLHFSYDLYSRTTSEVHQEIVQDIFLKLYHDGNIYKKVETLPFCENCQRFLADRYIEGKCPKCNFIGARGDQCDECGNLLDPQQLVNPHCKICAHAPVWRDTEHFFLRLSSFRDDLKKWVEKSEGWRFNAKNFTLNLLEQGLHDRPITRDIEWGIPIPLEGYDTKRIYVWFEAVCGYLSASKEWARLNGQPDLWEQFWLNESATHFYVHGKDNIPFHTIIWPAILLAYGGLHLPDRIFSSEYLTLEKRQFSKSRHWAVWLPDFLAQFDPESLRYYLVAAGPETADADFSWSEFRLRINAELIGNFGNYIHRVLSLIKANFPEGVEFPERPNSQQDEFLRLAKESFSLVGQAIENGHFRKGLRAILQLAEHGNRFINNAAPWAKIKGDCSQAGSDLAVAAQVIRCLAILASPYLPISMGSIHRVIEAKSSPLVNWLYPKPGYLTVGNPKPLYRKIEMSEVKQQRSRLGNEG